MVRLEEREMQRLLDAIHDVREVSDPDEFGADVLHHVAQLVPADHSSFNEVDPVGGNIRFALEPSTHQLPANGYEIMSRLAHQHPLIAHVARTGDGSARRISDVLSVEQWRASPIYEEYYRPIGIEHQMSIALPAPRPIVIGIALNRADDDFTDTERAMLNLIRPHLAQSWRLAREHHRLRELLATATGALESTGARVIVLADRPFELAPGALTDLYRYFGRPGTTDPLPSRVARWVAIERERLRTGTTELARPLTASAPGGRGRLALRFLPSASDHPDAIMLHDIGMQSPRTLDAVGLTRREAEIMRFVATGSSNAEIGAALHVAAATVKKHLDNVYAKLGVSGRLRASAALAEMIGHHDLGELTDD